MYVCIKISQICGIKLNGAETAINPPQHIRVLVLVLTNKRTKEPPHNKFQMCFDLDMCR